MGDGNGWVLGVDVGGTWTRMAAIDPAGRLVARLRHLTGPAVTRDDVRTVWSGLYRELWTGVGAPRPAAVGIGSIGPVEVGTGRLMGPPNAGPGLDGIGLVEEFRALTGTGPVTVLRDTNAALLGEATVGAGRGADELVYLTVSTGIGGAVLTQGRLLAGRCGGAAEVGHVVVVPDGPVCGCGRRGCLEAVAAGPAIARQARAQAGRSEAAKLGRMVAEGQELSAAAVAAAAAAGDPVAAEVLAGAGRAVVSAIVDLANLFDPERIVVGGAVAQGNPTWLSDAAAAVAATALEPTRRHTAVVPALLGDDAVLIGAAYAVRGAVVL